jgi:aminoglycoside phosphotransferase (APT) family kinase protein
MDPDAAATEIGRERSWVSTTRIHQGWSSDTKYRVVSADGQELMLRITGIDQLKRKQFEYQCLERVAALGIVMPTPKEFGVSDDGTCVYTLLAWVAGTDAECAIPSLTSAEQYGFGVKAGTALAAIHSLDGEIEAPSWETHYAAKIERVIRWYESGPARLPHDDTVLRFVRESAGLLGDRPIRLQHGDFHLGSLVVTPELDIGVIDFNRCSCGDPWEEYDRYVFTWSRSAAFASGQIDGYFDGQPPDSFFPLLKLYNGVHMLASMPWAASFGDDQVQVMRENADAVSASYDGFESAVPTWYRDAQI